MNPDNKPLAPQGAVVVVTQASPAEVDKRIRQSQAYKNPRVAYEGGADAQNYRVLRGDILVGKRHRVHMGTGGQKSYETVISSWNGVHKEMMTSPIDLANQYYFAGISLTDFDPTSKSGPRSALSTLVAGPVQIRMNADANIYAGDTVCWRPPAFDARMRKQKRFVGQPPNKLHTTIKRLDWNDLRKVNQVTFLDAIQQNVASRDHITSTSSGLTGAERRALAFSKHHCMIGMQMIDLLARQGLLLIVTPEVDTRAQVITEELANGLLGNNNTLWEHLTGATSGNGVFNGVPATNPFNGTNIKFKNKEGASTDDEFFKDPTIYLNNMLIPGRAPGVGLTAAAKNRNAKIDASVLWLAMRSGTIGGQNLLPPDVKQKAAQLRSNLLKKTNHIFVPHTEVARFAPNFSALDKDANNNLTREYIQCSRDSTIEYEQVLAEHKSALGQTAIGVCMSSASADATDPKLDLLVGFPSGNVTV